VIEAEFGFPSEVLLGPELDAEPATQRHSRRSERPLRTVDFVSWLADRSGLPFDALYSRVAVLVDEIASGSVVDRVTQARASGAVSRASLAEAAQQFYGLRSPGSGFYGAKIGHAMVSSSVLTRPEWTGLAVPLDSDHECFSVTHAPDSDQVDL